MLTEFSFWGELTL